MRALALFLITACTTAHPAIDRTDCTTCHAPEYEATPNVVAACTPTDHVMAGYGRTCANCHGTTSWCPADAKHTKFDLTTTSHAGWDCADCHTAITYDPPAITDKTITGLDCTSCHWHDRGHTDPHHTGNGNYTYGPQTCMAAACHGGRARQ